MKLPLLPFDLETARAHPERVICRDGTKPSVLGFDSGHKWPVVGRRNDTLQTWSPKGELYLDGELRPADLLLTPDPYEVMPGHNPSRVTWAQFAELPGEGWRVILPEEVKSIVYAGVPDSKLWCDDEWLADANETYQYHIQRYTFVTQLSKEELAAKIAERTAPKPPPATPWGPEDAIGKVIKPAITQCPASLSVIYTAHQQTVSFSATGGTSYKKLAERFLFRTASGEWKPCTKENLP